MSNQGLEITICSTSYHEYDRRLIRIANALIEEGYVVKWISRSRNKTNSEQDLINHKTINTVIKKGPLFYLEFNIRLFWMLLFSKVSIITAVDLDTISACVLAGWIKRVEVVHDAHEIFYEVPELTGKKIKKAIWKNIAKIFLPSVKHNYTVNISLANHYNEHYKRPYQVIRNVPDIAVKTESKSNNKTLVYLGVLNKGRGLELAIEAMRLLPSYKLLLVGEGDISDQLREQATGLTNVIFCGYTKPDKIANFLNQATIGLNMLIADSLNYKLSLANKFFDYMHAGLPSINMAYPEYLHILKDHEVGLALSDYTVQALCSALEQLENPEHFARLSNNCQLHKKHYTWANEKKKLLTLYSKIA